MKVLQKAFSQVPSCLPGGFSEAGLSNSNVRNVRAAEALVYVWTKHSKDVSVTPPPARMNVPPLPSCQRRVSSSGSIFANLVMKKKRHFVSVGISLISSRVLTPFHVTQLHFLLRGRHSVLYLPGSDTFV